MNTANGFPASLLPPPAGPIMTPMPASPFEIAPQRDDTALFTDARAGFSHLLPGRPVLAAPAIAELPSDVDVHLQDAPIAIRYRFEPPGFSAPTAAAVAKGTAERISTFRAGGAVSVDFANPSWLGAWSVEAAAVASYDVIDAPNAPPAALHEDLFVLVRQGMVMTVRWTYPRGFIDDPAYATFASVAEATMIWDRARWQQHGRVWPESAFLGAGLFGRTKPKYLELSKPLTAGRMLILPMECAKLFSVLSAIVSGAGAPWVVLSPEVRDAHRRDLMTATTDGTVRAFVDHAFADVRTAHDLRGLAVVVGRALDPRGGSSIPPRL